MGASGLSSRAIIGEFFKQLDIAAGAAWISNISMLFQSDQESETYKWLGMSPAMREWVGGRNAKGFRENGITITNKEYEATMEVLTKELRRDKTGQILIRIRELADRTITHWASLLSTLIINGTSTVCYDGQFFFDTDHSEGDSGTQDNDLTISIVDKDAPTTAEMEAAILSCISQILKFKDDQAEPMNENARAFRVMTPINMLTAAMAAINNPTIVDGSGSRQATIPTSGFDVTLDANARLTATDVFYVFRSNANVAAFIRQEEEALQIDAIAEGSELEFNENKHHYGVKATRNVGYGYWQHACVKTFTTT